MFLTLTVPTYELLTNTKALLCVPANLFHLEAWSDVRWCRKLIDNSLWRITSHIFPLAPNTLRKRERGRRKLNNPITTRGIPKMKLVKYLTHLSVDYLRGEASLDNTYIEVSKLAVASLAWKNTWNIWTLNVYKLSNVLLSLARAWLSANVGDLYFSYYAKFKHRDIPTEMDF